MQKAIGYIRVSAQSQADKGVSVKAQRAKILARCELNDAELVGQHCQIAVKHEFNKIGK